MKKISNYYMVEEIEDFDNLISSNTCNFNFIAKARKQKTLDYYLIVGKANSDDNNNNFKKEIEIYKNLKLKNENICTIKEYLIKINNEQHQQQAQQQQYTIDENSHKNNNTSTTPPILTTSHYLIKRISYGYSFQRMIESDQFLSLDTCKLLSCNLINALHYLHCNNVIYGDLKPSNILIDSKGVYKLNSIHNSILINNNSSNNNNQTKQQIINIYNNKTIEESIYYLSPELLKGYTYSFSSDMWAFGVLLFKCVTGYLPFFSQTNDSTKLIESIIYDQYLPPVIKLMSTTSTSQLSIHQQHQQQLLFNDLISKLLEKNPLKRINWSKLLVHPFFQQQQQFIESQQQEILNKPSNTTLSLFKNIQSQQQQSQRSPKLSPQLRSPKFQSPSQQQVQQLQQIDLNNNDLSNLIENNNFTKLINEFDHSIDFEASPIITPSSSSSSSNIVIKTPTTPTSPPPSLSQLPFSVTSSSSSLLSTTVSFIFNKSVKELSVLSDMEIIDYFNFISKFIKTKTTIIIKLSVLNYLKDIIVSQNHPVVIDRILSLINESTTLIKQLIQQFKISNDSIIKIKIIYLIGLIIRKSTSLSINHKDSFLQIFDLLNNDINGNGGSNPIDSNGNGNMAILLKRKSISTFGEILFYFSTLDEIILQNKWGIPTLDKYINTLLNQFLSFDQQQSGSGSGGDKTILLYIIKTLDNLLITRSIYMKYFSSKSKQLLNQFLNFINISQLQQQQDELNNNIKISSCSSFYRIIKHQPILSLSLIDQDTIIDMIDLKLHWRIQISFLNILFIIITINNFENNFSFIKLFIDKLYNQYINQKNQINPIVFKKSFIFYSILKDLNKKIKAV